MCAVALKGGLLDDSQNPQMDQGCNQPLAVGVSRTVSVTFSRTAGILLRLGISVGSLALVYFLIDLDVAEVWRLLSSIDPVLAIVSVVLMLAQLLLTAIRWFFVNRALDIAVSRQACLRLMFIGQFFNQCLPTSVGGDAVKIGFLFRGYGVAIKTASLSVVMDRLVGVVVLVLVALVGWATFIWLWPERVPQQDTLTVLLMALVLGASCVVFVCFPFIAHSTQRWARLPQLQAIAAVSNRLALRWPGSVFITVCSIVVQILIAISIFIGAYALDIALPPSALGLMPLILFVASLPFSFAGWGLREGAMVTGLSILGVAAPEAISISVLHGLTQLVIGLPGAFILMVGKSRG